jgi:hypothetical protein
MKIARLIAGHFHFGPPVLCRRPFAFGSWLTVKSRHLDGKALVANE